MNEEGGKQGDGKKKVESNHKPLEAGDNLGEEFHDLSHEVTDVGLVCRSLNRAQRLLD